MAVTGSPCRSNLMVAMISSAIQPGDLRHQFIAGASSLWPPFSNNFLMPTPPGGRLPGIRSGDNQTDLSWQYFRDYTWKNEAGQSSYGWIVSPSDRKSPAEHEFLTLTLDLCYPSLIWCADVANWVMYPVVGKSLNNLQLRLYLIRFCDAPAAYFFLRSSYLSQLPWYNTKE